MIFDNLMGVRITSDTGWIMSPSSSEYRKMFDYHRLISFERELFENELRDSSKILFSNECPGKTGVVMRKVTEDESEKYAVNKNLTYICLTSNHEGDNGKN